MSADQAPKVTRARMIIEFADGVPCIPKEVWLAIDARLDVLPQPDSRFERDRWRMISREAVYAAAPILAGPVPLEQDSREIPPDLAERAASVIDAIEGRLIIEELDHPLLLLRPYLARIAGRQA